MNTPGVALAVSDYILKDLNLTMHSLDNNVVLTCGSIRK